MYVCTFVCMYECTVRVCRVWRVDGTPMESWYLNIYVCMYIYVYMYVRMHVCIVYECMFVCMYVCTYVYGHG
jgi:hypothetical protein